MRTPRYCQVPEKAEMVTVVTSCSGLRPTAPPQSSTTSLWRPLSDRDLSMKSWGPSWTQTSMSWSRRDLSRPPPTMPAPQFSASPAPRHKSLPNLFLREVRERQPPLEMVQVPKPSLQNSSLLLTAKWPPSQRYQHQQPREEVMDQLSAKDVPGKRVEAPEMEEIFHDCLEVSYIYL